MKKTMKLKLISISLIIFSLIISIESMNSFYSYMFQGYTKSKYKVFLSNMPNQRHRTIIFQKIPIFFKVTIVIQGFMQRNIENTPLH
jgi:hypothetical protein